MSENSLKTADVIIKQYYRSTNSFLAAKEGKMIQESYYNGYGKEDPQPVMSVTKSIVSALMGIAIDKGFIAGVHERVADYFREWVSFDTTNYLLKEMTIRHLLAMESGFLWKTAKGGQEPVFDKVCRSENWVKTILKLPVRRENFESFQYNSGNSHLLAAILTRAAGMSVREFANKHLFEPMELAPIPESATGIDFSRGMNGLLLKQGTQRGWAADPMGIHIGGFGLTMRPVDMLSFGCMYLNRGMWKDKRIIESGWILESVQDHRNSGYGYHFRIMALDGYRAYCAVGYGGQYIIMIPELALVIVFTSDTEQSSNGGHALLDVVKRYILPELDVRNPIAGIHTENKDGVK